MVIWSARIASKKYRAGYAKSIGVVLLLTSAWAHSEMQWAQAVEVNVLSSTVTEAPKKGTGGIYSLGLDGLGYWVGETRNFATIVLQADVWCAANLEARPAFIEKKNGCAPVFRTASVNLHALPDGKFNIALGHMEMPFGLEGVVSTNRTLRQVPTTLTLGQKMDWGVGVNGSVFGKTYTSTLTRGTGMEYLGGTKNWAWAGRIGTAVNDLRFLPNPGFGVSWFAGNVRLGNGELSDRRMLAIDMTRYVRRLGILTQISLGRMDDRRVITALGEVNLADSAETKAGYLQVKTKNIDTPHGWAAETALALGVRFGESIGSSFSAQYVHELENIDRSGGRGLFQMQFKLRWN